VHTAVVAPCRSRVSRSTPCTQDVGHALLQGDTGVTRELEAYEAERFKQMSRHLDLMWSVGKVWVCTHSWMKQNFQKFRYSFVRQDACLREFMGLCTAGWTKHWLSTCMWYWRDVIALPSYSCLAGSGTCTGNAVAAPQD
jgi:hypothetical protein